MYSCGWPVLFQHGCARSGKASLLYAPFSLIMEWRVQVGPQSLGHRDIQYEYVTEWPVLSMDRGHTFLWRKAIGEPHPFSEGSFPDQPPGWASQDFPTPCCASFSRWGQNLAQKAVTGDACWDCQQDICLLANWRAALFGTTCKWFT